MSTILSPEQQASKAANDVIVLAKEQGVTLDIDTVSLEISAKPKSRLTPEVRLGIKHQRDHVIRALLFRRSARYLQAELGRRGVRNGSRREESVYTRMRDEIHSRIPSGRWYELTPKEFKAELGRSLKLALNELGDFGDVA